ncbi:monocarboxylate transporter [Culex quinquefasciatus]|uniref:Monocarboxylate transporter n=1 Tax=Culex quinquefasciatus TaxID=7176 RepID=B0WIT2_CULQU|nr:monocarboxylate transporter [Culex quinquefasciatus]|eukprot:XP_001848616.1 monocarboxylate transporter [Culex quinquefasciatus]
MNLFVCIPKTPKRIETIKSELGLEMRFAALMDVGLLRDMIYRNILFGLTDFNKIEVAFFLTNIAARVIVPPIGDKLRIKKRLLFMLITKYYDQFGVDFLFFLVENKKQPSKQWLTADCVNASSTSCRKRGPPTRSPVIGIRSWTKACMALNSVPRVSAAS